MDMVKLRTFSDNLLSDAIVLTTLYQAKVNIVLPPGH
jgi:hypothetical protein